MSTWKTLLEFVETLSEARRYRGDTDVRLKDLQKLGEEIGFEPDSQGGTVRTEYKFTSSVWKGWQDKLQTAVAIASTDTKRVVQTGNPQGGTVHKTNWGGRVVNVPAPIRPHHDDRIGSTMDRYDVLMTADIEETVRPDGKTVETAILRRLTWSPSIGSQEERAKRLMAINNGLPPPPLPRRAQGDVPDAPPDSTMQPQMSTDDPHRRGYADRPNTPSSGYRTGKGSQAARDSNYEYPSWLKGHGKKR